MGNLLNRYGPAAYENLYGFEEKPKTFGRVVRAVTEPEKKVENLAPSPEATVKPKLEELREAIAEIPARKKGRPSKGQPWKEAGISKAAWYKRQQKEKSGG